MPTLNALAKISEQDETGEALTSLVRDVNSKYAAGDASVQVPVGVRLWKTPGCHEFLASLGKFHSLCHHCTASQHHVMLM